MVPLQHQPEESTMTDRMYTIRIPFLGKVFAATPNYDECKLGSGLEL